MDFSDTIIVGYDGSDQSAMALRWAARLAKSGRKPLAIIHAWIFPLVTKDLGPVKGVSGSGHRNVADPFRFTLGGPLRLTASAFEEYRGTDYGLIRPAYFRRIADLPTPLGQSIYVIGTYEFGTIAAPGRSTLTRQDVFFGLAAETPLGAITFGPAFGSDGERCRAVAVSTVEMRLVVLHHEIEDGLVAFVAGFV